VVLQLTSPTSFDPAPSAGATGRAVDITELSVQFGGLHALRDIDIQCVPGEVVGVVGPNGAGKTTLLNVISRTVPLTTGTVRIFDEDVTSLKSFQVETLGVGRSFQLADRFSRVTAGEYMMLGLQSSIRSRALWIALGMGFREERRAWERCATELAAYGLEGVERDTPLGSLPYGIRKRIDLARVTVSQPRLMLLDEPTSGLSEAESSEIAERWKELKKDDSRQQMTVLVVDHRVGFVRQLCDRLVVISYGRKIADGACDEVLSQPEVQEAFMGRALSAETVEAEAQAEAEGQHIPGADQVLGP
jgi:branched-chain amino acid transport system ATP-binding protein